MEVLFWLCTSALVAFMVQLCWRRLRWVKAQTGTTAWQRMADKVLLCRVCRRPVDPEVIDVDTGTCGQAACVGHIMRARARLAEARQAAERVLEPAMVQGVRADKTPMFSAAGDPIMVRDPSGEWVARHVPGGALTDGDRAALAWVRQHGG
jgi:hypothetical protein